MNNHMDHDERKGSSGITPKVLWGVGGVLMMLGIVCSVILSIFCYRQNQELTKLIRENVLNEPTKTQEDDIKIAGEYYVRSTLPISDAYKSGDTSKLDDKQKKHWIWHRRYLGRLSQMI